MSKLNSKIDNVFCTKSKVSKDFFFKIFDKLYLIKHMQVNGGWTSSHRILKEGHYNEY